MLSNPITFQAGLYEELPPFAGGNFLFSMKRMNEQTGFTVEVFRSGTWQQSVRGDNARVQRGDALLKINMKQATLTWTGNFTTRNLQNELNRYTHIYQAIVQVAVWDSRQFAICCMQSADPLEQARTLIAHEFESQAARDEFESLTDQRFRRLILDRSRAIETNFGMCIVEKGVIRVEPKPDPRWQAEWDLREQLRLDAIKQEEARTQNGLNVVSAAQAEAQATIIKGAGEAIARVTQSHISELAREGMSPLDILRSPGLGNVVPQFDRPIDQGQLGDGTDQSQSQQRSRPDLLDSDSTK